MSACRTSKLQRQKGIAETPLGGVGGPSVDSQQSKNSLSVPLASSTTTTTPSSCRRHHVNPQLVQQLTSDSGDTRSAERRAKFKWSGVTISFDADSAKIENEVNGAPPGIKSIGKEVGNISISSFLLSDACL